MSEWAKSWVAKLTVSRPDTSEREVAYDVLRGHFAEMKQAELMPGFLLLTENASSRQKRILADIVALEMLPGDAWLAVLKEHRYEHCRRLARVCTKHWSEQLVTGALIQAIEKALQDQDEARLHWVMRLTLEIEKERQDVSFRPVERHLSKKLEAQRKRRTKSLVDLRLKAFHTNLLEVIAPADTPLTASAPRTDKGLPLPSDVSSITSDDLPLPADGAATKSKPGFWQRLFAKFRK